MRFHIILSVVALATADQYAVFQLENANNKFATKLFSEVLKQHPEENLVVSGFSVAAPLAQLSSGAVGPTHDEILTALGLHTDDVAEVAYPVVNRNLQALHGVELNTANRLYVQNGLKVNKTFSSFSKQVFDSDVKNVNFVDSERAAAEINKWVEDKTKHHIKNFVDKDEVRSISTLLVNAIYFKGTWTYPFDKSATSDMDFHVNSRKTVKVPMMYQSSVYVEFGYSDVLKAKLVRLPYKGDSASLLVVLPDDVDGLEATHQQLSDHLTFFNAKKDMTSKPTNLYLPKFTIETTLKLKDVLQNMGVTTMFTPAARFDNVLDSGSLLVTQVKQKAYLEVNEHGVEAAAATAVDGVSSVSPDYIKEFKADRPFYFELNAGNVVLFSGVYRG